MVPSGSPRCFPSKVGTVAQGMNWMGIAGARGSLFRGLLTTFGGNAFSGCLSWQHKDSLEPKGLGGNGYTRDSLEAA